MMHAGRAVVCNKKGLHARAAARLVKLAGTFDAHIEVIRLPRPNERAETCRAGATSILSLLMLAAERGVTLELMGEGPDAEAAIAAIVALIERRFDEEA